MNRTWTFGRTLAAGFALNIVLTTLVGAVGIAALRSVESDNRRVITVDQQLVILSARMEEAVSEKRALARGYLMSGNEQYLKDMAGAREDFQGSFKRAQELTTTADGQRVLAEVSAAEARHQAAIDEIVALRRKGSSLTAVNAEFERVVTPARLPLLAALDAFSAAEQTRAGQAYDAARRSAQQTEAVLVALLVVGVLLAAGLSSVITRRVRRLVGRAVAEVRSSSAELQASASQQASSARQQATAMSEITTTVTELLATSRQIAESAQRVAQVADRTAGAGRAGGTTVDAAHRSMTDIRQQVDVIVNHMVELGDKSQRIGAVLDIVSELAEQTNILAINSTIEAAGAGESGRRFAVVADEIRKLADRVAESTKEIRSLIEVVRTAVNTTVMATEIGAKAVDGGARRFGEVASSFDEIAGLVSTTTEAAREIELSTRQQASAVEQVTIAVTSVTQATREAEASSSQTLLTASQLADLSRQLEQLVQVEAGR